MRYPYENLAETGNLPMFLMMTRVKYIPLHWHDRIEFVLILQGSVHTYVDHKEYLLKENDLLFINSNEIHGVESFEENRVVVLQIPISLIHKYYQKFDHELLKSHSLLQKNVKSYKAVRSAILKMLIVLKQKEEGYELIIQSLLLEIIYQLITNLKNRNKNIIDTNRKNTDRLNRIMRYIEENFMYPLTLQEIAEKEQITVPYLSQYFRKHTGQSFIKYLNNIRLEHAAKRLLETDLSVIDIALESGFSSLNTFHKLFKDTFHTTPNKYRKRNKMLPSHMIQLTNKPVLNYQYKEERDIELLQESLTNFKKDKKQYEYY